MNVPTYCIEATRLCGHGHSRSSTTEHDFPEIISERVFCALELAFSELERITIDDVIFLVDRRWYGPVYKYAMAGSIGTRHAENVRGAEKYLLLSNPMSALPAGLSTAKSRS